MSSLRRAELRRVEELLEMSSGYVCDFSDRTFGDFFIEEVGVDIGSDEYLVQGTSKAIDCERSSSLKGTRSRQSADALIDDHVDVCRFGPRELVEACRAIAEAAAHGRTQSRTTLSSCFRVRRRSTPDADRSDVASVETDPALAIGTAKELVETCCKTTSQTGEPHYRASRDMSTLTKAVLKKPPTLFPEAISDGRRGASVVRRLLSNLGTIGNGLAELRGLYGTGHGPEGGASGLQPRHADWLWERRRRWRPSCSRRMRRGATSRSEHRWTAAATTSASPWMEQALGGSWRRSRRRTVRLRAGEPAAVSEGYQHPRLGRAQPAECSAWSQPTID